MTNFGMTSIQNVGVFSDVASISVDENSAVAHTLSSDKRGVIIMNVGTGICWFGGSTVDPANNRGIELLPKVSYHFDRAKPGFKIWFKCAAGVTTTIGVAEYS